MPFPPFHIGDLTITKPIVQGGMAIGISLSGLASAVANAGGVGTIATAGIGYREPDYETNTSEANTRAFVKEIRRARERITKSGGALAVNIMVALTNYKEMVTTACKEGVDVIFSGAGLPLALPKIVEEAVGDGERPKLAPIVSSARAAAIIAKKWKARGATMDAVVLEGPLAGGHLGFKAEQVNEPAHKLENLLPQLVETMTALGAEAKKHIPVIAAGGIYSGKDIRTMLGLGASAVQLGTRFVATHECDAADAFKQKYVAATEEDVQLVKSPVGLPGRAIHNRFIDDSEAGRAMPDACRYDCLSACDYTEGPYCIAQALTRACQGDAENGLVFCGANAHRVDSICSVQELVSSLEAEYDVSA